MSIQLNKSFFSFSECSAPFELIGGNCLFLSDASRIVSFTNAQTECESMGGFLAIPELSQTNDAFGTSIHTALGLTMGTRNELLSI